MDKWPDLQRERSEKETVFKTIFMQKPVISNPEDDVKTFPIVIDFFSMEIQLVSILAAATKPSSALPDTLE